MLERRGPDVLWRPDPDHRGPLARFTDWLREHKGVEARDYAALHAWSVTDLDGFWSAVAEFLGRPLPHAAHGRARTPRDARRRSGSRAPR